MSTALLVAIGFTGMALLAAFLQWRAAPAVSIRRRMGLLALWLLSMVCLYFMLYPPSQRLPAGQRVVLTAHAETVSPIPNGVHWALPEAPTRSVKRFPDLATAVRQQPEISAVHIVGDGLTARDRESVRGLSLRFSASETPIGLIEFWQSPTIRLGSTWQVRGRVHGMAGGQLEWLDPSGAMQTRQGISDKGEFSFSQSARAQGRMLYRLRVRYPDGRVQETWPVPVWVQPARSLAVMNVAGAPNAELKALRRWALDSGQTLRSRIEMAPGMVLDSDGVDFSAPGLLASDVLILDERAWQNASAAQRRQIRTAMQNGLGVLLRITGPLSATTRADFIQMGVRIDATLIPQTITLQGAGNSPELNRQPVRVQAVDGQAVLRSRDGSPLALWRPYGQGRLGVMWLSDTYRLALMGSGDAHGALWSALLSAVARPFVHNGPLLADQPHWQGQRTVMCGLAQNAVVEVQSQRIPLFAETQGTHQGCAGYWPRTAGWQQLQSGEHMHWFYVHSSQQGQALQRQQNRIATQALTATQPAASTRTQESIPGSPWPWFVAWLIVCSLLWWLERQFVRVRAGS